MKDAYMFLSCHNAYLLVLDDSLALQFLCHYYDDPSGLVDFDIIASNGYEVIPVSEGKVAFFKEGKGYLSARADLSLCHVGHLERCETFRQVDVSRLPAAIPVFPEADHIARNIHQIGIYKTNPGSYPQEFVENKNKVVALNPNYTFYFWSEGGFYDIEKFIMEHYNEEVFKYYRSINPEYPAVRADFFRYLCIYALGGVYFDLKTTISYPLDEIIRPSDRFILSFWYHGDRGHEEIKHISYGEYEQYYIMCAAGHPLMRYIVQQAICNIAFYDRDIHGVGQYGVLRTTGPFMYSMIIHEYRKFYEDTLRRIHSFSNGIEYTIYDSSATHRTIVEDSVHYIEKNEPLVHNDVI